MSFRVVTCRFQMKSLDFSCAQFFLNLIHALPFSAVFVFVLVFVMPNITVYLDHDGVGIKEVGVEISDPRDHRLDRCLAPERQLASERKSFAVCVCLPLFLYFTGCVRLILFLL